ncbi:sugar transferase [Prochlorococcus sp. MIT 0604]|uniref:sugar transferase n=1 Tax=Prochlorococcus sp. MIT 0604 TaxID=1501268 RepID=UPI000B2710C5|nr:sugar transferase [Prochlorococcus sp. MIT 0604]
MKKLFSFKNFLFLVDSNLFLDIKKNFSEEFPNTNLICLKDINEIENYNENNTLVITAERHFSNKYKYVKQISLFKFYQIYFENIPTKIFSISNINKYRQNFFYLNFQKLLKRIFDISISLIILFFSFPLLMIIFLLIKIEDGGPILYKQLRTGQNNKFISIYKIRSMRINSEKNGPKWCEKRDNRITKIGSFIRKTKIDELPQLCSVLKGDMSLIGPRPERPEFDKLLSESITDYNFRYKVKPGLSGWAQVNQKYPSSIEESKIKLNYDFYYINNFSLWLDFLIFFKTIRLVINIDDR